MKIDKQAIIFLVRSYNEATRIESTLASILDAGFTEILVVDDGSQDNTQELLDTAFPGLLHRVRHTINRGPGAALETGFEFIRRFGKERGWHYVVSFDADGQLTIDNIGRFIEAFESDPSLDIVFGSRFIEKTKTNVPLLRRCILWGGKIFTTLVSGIRLTDAHNGYRMLRREVLDNVHLTMDGMEYASELIDQVAMLRLKWSEVPVDVTYDEYTLAKGQRYGGPFRVATRMIWKKFF